MKGNEKKTHSRHVEPENNLSDEQERVHLLYQQSPFAYQSLDKDGFITEVNTAWLAMLGYPPQASPEVVGKWIGEFLTPKSQEKFKKQFSKFVSSGSLQAAVFEMVCRDGKTIAVEVDGKIGTDKNGHFRQTHCILRNITKQREAEDKLSLLSSVVHQCREGIAVADLQYNLLFMNRSYAQMHGYEPSELFGKSIAALHTPEQMIDIDKAIQSIKQHGEFKGQVGRKRKDGSVFPSLMHISFLSDSSGEPLGIIGIILDISELKRIEDELRRERDLAQKYLDIAGVILIVVGADRKVKMINKKGCGILGFSQQDIIDKDWFENFIVPQQKDKVKIVFDAMMKEHKDAAEYYENDIITRSGEVRTIAWHNTILADDTGAITGILSSGLDITEQKKAETWLRSQHSLAIALNKMSDLTKALRIILRTAMKLDEVDCGGIYLVDEKTGGLDLVVFDGLSPQFVNRVSHYEADAPQTGIVLQGKAVYQLCSEFEPAVRESLVNEGLRSLFVIPIRHEGKIIGSLNLASRNYDQISPASRNSAEILAAEVGGVVARIKAEEALKASYNELEKKVEERTAQLSKAYKDLEAETEQRKLKEKMLRENEKFAATGRLAARIAHEINNPLAGIKNAFLLVKDAVPEEYEYYNYVSLIEKEISRVSRIVHQMLELYRPQQESPIEFRFADLVREVVVLHEIACREHNVKLEIDIDDSLKVLLSEGMLKQVLFNLIDNAVKASKPDGVVRVWAKFSNGILTFNVADKGIGIKKDIQDKVFEPFFTADTDGSKRGLGLGLAITKSIVDAMGGSIGFESEYGSGSVFTVSIPLCASVPSPKTG